MSDHLSWTLRVVLMLVGLVLTLLLCRGLAIINQPLTENGIGRILLSEGSPEEAMHVFSEPKWQAVALYRAGRYTRSIGAFSEDRELRSLYNIGNAYAQLGRYDEAVEVFEEVIRTDSEHEDARFNLELVRKAAALARNRNEQGDSGLANRNDDSTPEATDLPAEESAQQDIIQTVRNQPSEQASEDLREDETTDDGKSEHAAADDGAQSAGQAGQAGDDTDRNDVPQSATSLEDDGEQTAELPSKNLTQQYLNEEKSIEGDMAEEILLRHINDRPRIVLKARLRMALKRATEEGNQ